MSIFCGIGVCQACIATGSGDRTCLEPPDGNRGEGRAGAVVSGGLVIVGAGPAGLSAALAAAGAGLDVLVLDRGGRPGGARRPAGLIRQALRQPRIAFRLGVDVWRAFPGRELHLTDGSVLRPEAIVLATGAHDRVLPFPGWHLPGVITVGGAQAQLKNGSPLSGRVLVAGRGPLLQVAAAALAGAGAEVTAIVDAATAGDWLRHPGAVLRSPARVAHAAWLRATLAARRVPLLSGWELTGVTAAEGGLVVTIRRHARRVPTAGVAADRGPSAPSPERATRTFIVDAVAVGDGFTPQVELAMALGAATTVDHRDGSVVVVADADQRTGADGVFAAGEVTGIGGAGLATATGTLAGLAAARHLGASVTISARLRRRARAQRRFADALHAVTAVPPGWTGGVPGETVACRCEGVTFGQARAAIGNLGVDDLRALKLVTRIGMGPCQGRYCGQAAADLLAADPAFFAYRPVAVPVPLELFASEEDHE